MSFENNLEFATNLRCCHEVKNRIRYSWFSGHQRYFSPSNSANEKNREHCSTASINLHVFIRLNQKIEKFRKKRQQCVQPLCMHRVIWTQRSTTDCRAKSVLYTDHNWKNNLKTMNTMCSFSFYRIRVLRFSMSRSSDAKDPRPRLVHLSQWEKIDTSSGRFPGQTVETRTGWKTSERARERPRPAQIPENWWRPRFVRAGHLTTRARHHDDDGL